MDWRKNPALNWKLYCIIDNALLRGASPEKIAGRLFASGAGCVQLRYKNYPSYKLVPIAKKIRVLARKYKKNLLVNDRVDAALASRADGLHLGNGDVPVRLARSLLKPKSVIGKTVHSMAEAKNVKREKIDYISVGPIFSTPLKKHLKKRGAGFVKKIKKHVSLPVLAIGGINKRNAKIVLGNGADGVCVTRAAREAKEILKEIT